MLHLYETLLNQKNSDGVSIVDPFMKKPSKKDYPSYYEVIKTPIDMEMILGGIKKNYYNSMEAFCADINLMFDNCKKYNGFGSKLFKTACDLHRVFMNKCKVLYPSLKSPKLHEKIKKDEKIKKEPASHFSEVSEAKRPYPCKTCGKGFGSAIILNHHIRKSHPISEENANMTHFTRFESHLKPKVVQHL